MDGMTPYYEDDGIVIYHGDCQEIVPDLLELEIDFLVLTDPPYGINHTSHGQLFRSAIPCRNDATLGVTMGVLIQLQDFPQVVFFSPYNPIPIEWRSVLVWHKGKDFGIGGDRATCWKRDIECIGVRNNPPLNGNRDSALLQFRGAKSRSHFCEKPLDLILYLIQKVPSETILDPFMGSGTTLRAAKDLGRKAIGIEIEEKYCEIAANRLAQGVLF
jgi:site-specific DNA-methyltransferase (adenine-specific)|tara:strand:+ start:1274 stop:1921 length:648 start_codon:yes stop_codon:yes gene_type:complete